MENKFELFKEMFELSQTEKRGLTFYFGGQTAPGIVTKMIGTRAVEIRNQTSSRMIVLIDSIEAVAVN